MEGIAGIATRMAQIQAQIRVFNPPPAAAPVQGARFAEALTDASAANLKQRYTNGNIPASALQQVGSTGHRLWAPAASALTDLIADARRAGVTIGITDSYRSLGEQTDLVRRKGLYSQGGLAAKPGTSDHGWGLAADLDLDDRAQAWMRANAGRYGFVENTPREPWHWKYDPAT